MKNLKKNNSGFTLIELIVVMIIIGILVLLATPRFLNYIKDANVTALQVDAKVLGDASLYHSLRDSNDGSEGDYPVTGEVKAVADLDEKLQLVIEENYKESYGGKDSITDMKLQQLDPKQISEHVRNTKNKIEDYYIVVEGPLQGEVFYNTVLENGRGVSYAGLLGFDLGLDKTE